MPSHAQSVTPKWTSTTPAVPHHSAQNSKPPSWLIEEMVDLDWLSMKNHIMPWPMDCPWHMLEVTHDDVTGCPHATSHNAVIHDDVNGCPHTTTTMLSSVMMWLDVPCNCTQCNHPLMMWLDVPMQLHTLKSIMMMWQDVPCPPAHNEVNCDDVTGCP